MKILFNIDDNKTTYRVDQKKGRSQKMKIGHGGGFLKKKSMSNKIKKFLCTLWKLFF